MLYLVFAYKFFILSYSPHFCDSIALCFVLNGAEVIELYVIKFASTSDMCFTGFFFLHKILYHSIRLICVILMHMVSSWKVQYLLSYLQFTMLKNKTIKIACFGNLGFKKMGILKKNKLLFRGGVSHKQRETWGFCQKQGFWLESSHFTRNTAAHLDLPLLDPLAPPTWRNRSHTDTSCSLDSSGIPQPTLPLIPQLILPSRPSSLKMTKIELPLLTSELDAPNVTSWLNLCMDSFEVWSAMNFDKTMKPSLQIVLAGLKMDSPPAKNWWNENHDTLKLLPTWDAFAQQVKNHFVPANWRMDGLAKFLQNFTRIVPVLGLCQQPPNC